MASKEIEILDPAASIAKLKTNATDRALNRRHFIAALGMTGAAAGTGMLSGCSTASIVPATTATLGQTDVLNFALNIKYLQATFYSYVTQGADLTGSAVTGSGVVTNAPAKLTFTGTNAKQITDMFDEIYYDEIHHVSTLTSLLGSAVVPRPAINLGAFGTITATNAIAIARLLEDVGVTAYAGAVAGLSTSDITITGQVLGADGFHSGALRLASIQNPTLAAYIKADSLDVAPVDSGSATVSAGGPTAAGAFFATAGAATSNTSTPAGFPFVRSTSQALAVLFGAPGTPASSGATSGGFFPSGVKGNIKSV
jgi:hypothetical protein